MIDNHDSRISEVYCCPICHAPVAQLQLPGGDLAYECQSPRCGKAVHSTCIEALALIEDIPFVLREAA